MSVLSCSRFPVISGLNVVWDSRLPPGQRVKSIDFISHLSKPQKPGKKEKNTAASLPATPSPEGSNSGEDDSSDDEGVCIELREQPDGTKLDIRRPRNAHVEPVSREKGGRTYKVVTREYMAEGYDGFDVMKGCNYLVGELPCLGRERRLADIRLPRQTARMAP